MIDNRYVYIQYNHGDRRVTYTHHQPILLLEEGISAEVKADPVSYKEFIEDKQRYYEAMGEFILKTNYEEPPTGDFLYDQFFNELTKSVSYSKRDVEMPAQKQIKESIKKTNEEVAELSNTNEHLKSVVNSQTEIITNLTDELSKSNSALEDTKKELNKAKDENSGILKDLLGLVASANYNNMDTKPDVNPPTKDDLSNTINNEDGPTETDGNKVSSPNDEGWLDPKDFGAPEDSHTKEDVLDNLPGHGFLDPNDFGKPEDSHNKEDILANLPGAEGGFLNPEDFGHKTESESDTTHEENEVVHSKEDLLAGMPDTGEAWLNPEDFPHNK